MKRILGLLSIVVATTSLAGTGTGNLNIRYALICKNNAIVSKNVRRYIPLFHLPSIEIPASADELSIANSYIESIANGDQSISKKLQEALSEIKSWTYYVHARLAEQQHYPDNENDIILSVLPPNTRTIKFECAPGQIAIKHKDNQGIKYLIDIDLYNSLSIQEKATLLVDLALNIFKSEHNNAVERLNRINDELNSTVTKNSVADLTNSEIARLRSLSAERDELSEKLKNSPIANDQKRMLQAAYRLTIPEISIALYGIETASNELIDKEISKYQLEIFEN